MAASGANARFRLIRNLQVLEITVPKERLGIEVVERDYSSELSYVANLEKITARSCNTLGESLLAYIGKYALINLESPTKTCAVLLIGAGQDHFTVMSGDNLVRYSYSQIICLSESVRFDTLTIIINHLIVYEGGKSGPAGFGLGIGVVIPLNIG